MEQNSNANPQSVSLEATKSEVSNHHREDSHHHHHKKKFAHISSRALIRYAFVVEILLFVFAIYQLMLTLMIPVGKSTNPLAAYSRNFSEVIGFAFIGWFLLQWFKFLLRVHRSRSYRLFKIMLVVAAVLSLSKGLISFLVINSFGNSEFAIYYYWCDCFAWVMLGCFFAFFFQLSIADKHLRKAIGKSRLMSIILAVVGLTKVLVSACFTIMQFKPGQMVWHFFLADTLAWVAITVFFALYSYSRLLAHANRKHNHSSHHRYHAHRPEDIVFEDVAKNRQRNPKDNISETRQ